MPSEWVEKKRAEEAARKAEQLKIEQLTPKGTVKYVESFENGQVVKRPYTEPSKNMSRKERRRLAKMFKQANKRGN